LHPVGIEPVTSCHASLTRLHILLMYWVNHLLDILGTIPSDQLQYAKVPF